MVARVEVCDTTLPVSRILKWKVLLVSVPEACTLSVFASVETALKGLSRVSADPGGGRIGVGSVLRGGIDDLDDLNEIAVGLSTMTAAILGCRLNL